MKTIFEIMKHNQLVRFFLIGSINTAFSYTLYAGFLYVGIPYALALLLATCMGVIFNFITTGTFVFKQAENRSLIKFIGVYVVLYYFNLELIGFFQHFWNDLYLDGLLAVLPVALTGFLLNKNFVFK